MTSLPDWLRLYACYVHDNRSLILYCVRAGYRARLNPIIPILLKFHRHNANTGDTGPCQIRLQSLRVSPETKTPCLKEDDRLHRARNRLLGRCLPAGRSSNNPDTDRRGSRFHHVAQAIEMIEDQTERDKLRERLNRTLGHVRDQDGSWNDRVFGRSKAFGTAMAIMALQMGRIPRIPSWGGTRDL